MSKRKSKRVVGFFIAIMTLITIGLLVVGLFGDKILPLLSGGFTTLSIGQAEFTSSEEFFSGTRWIMTVIQGGLAQHATARFDQTEIDDATGTKPEKPFNIDIDYTSQNCEYDINKNYDAKPITQLHIKKEWSCLVSPSSEEITNQCGDWKYGGKYSLSLTCFCIEEIKVADYADIGSPTVVSKGYINVDNGQETSQLQFNTKTSTQGFVKPGYVYWIWHGDVVIDSCEDKDPYYSFYKDGSWKIGSTALYNQYVSTVVPINAILPGGGYDKNYVVEKINAWNTAANRAVEERIFGYVREPTSATSAIVVKELGSFIQKGLHTFIIKSDYLGIYQPISKPVIIDTTSAKFKAGEVGEIYVKFMNDGDERGCFKISADCTEPFEMEGNILEKCLNGGDEDVIYIKISADTDRPDTGTCEVKVQAATKTARRTVDVAVDPQTICEPGEYDCLNNGVWACNEFGSGRDLVKQCKDTEKCVYEDPLDKTKGAKCVDKGAGGDCDSWWSFLNPACLTDVGDCGWNIICHINKALAGFYMYIGLIAGIISGAMFYNRFSKDAKKSEKKWFVLLAFIIFIMVSILLGTCNFIPGVCYGPGLIWLAILILIGIIIAKIMLK